MSISLGFLALECVEMLKLLVVVLTGVMAYLKWTGQFDYSWWVVFSPVLAYLALGIILLVGTFIAHMLLR